VLPFGWVSNPYSISPKRQLPISIPLSFFFFVLLLTSTVLGRIATISEHKARILVHSTSVLACQIELVPLNPCNELIFKVAD
jgi:uncharacterized membrane protein